MPEEDSKTFEKLFEYFRNIHIEQHEADLNSDLKLARAILVWASNNFKANSGMPARRGLKPDPATPSELINMSGEMSEVQLFDILFRLELNI